MPVSNALVRRKHSQGDWPTSPQRGVDGRMYGPGYDADPTGGTDSSPVQKQYGSSWLDNVVKLADNGLLHPEVLEMLRPQIEAMIKSQRLRGQDFSDDVQDSMEPPPDAVDPGEARGPDTMRPQRSRY